MLLSVHMLLFVTLIPVSGVLLTSMNIVVSGG